MCPETEDPRDPRTEFVTFSGVAPTAAAVEKAEFVRLQRGRKMDRFRTPPGGGPGHLNLGHQDGPGPSKSV